VANAIETITVKHVSGNASTLLFKAFEQGRGKWQANSVDLVWFDEEPPADVYFEGITRTNATKGIVFTTFTPLKGMSDVVARFLMEVSPDRHSITMTIDDAGHYSQEEKERIIASYPPHEVQARTLGVPSYGSGRVFPISETDITCEPFHPPRTWALIGGMDFGWDHPFAAVKCAFDRDADIFYIMTDFREREQTPVLHSATLRTWGDKLDWAWPHDGLQHDKGSGTQLMELYRDQKLNMLSEKATFEDGSNGVEAGLMEMLDRMKTGRWKVFNTAKNWLEEFRMYHRKDGRVVKERDDVISASRYAMMMKRFARTNEDRKVKARSYAGALGWMG
jgi:phage terminase large subunit-like protein